MTSRDFAYWLQGFIEIHGIAPTEAQWTIIKNHLNLVFVHEIDPSMPDPKGKLQAAHDGKPTNTIVDHLPPRPWDPNTLIRC